MIIAEPAPRFKDETAPIPSAPGRTALSGVSKRNAMEVRKDTLHGLRGGMTELRAKESRAKGAEGTGNRFRPVL